VRLCKRSRKLLTRGKHANQVVVAIARELVGFIWAITKEMPATPYVHKTDGDGSNKVANVQRASEETPPRWGATPVGVTRPAGILGPRVGPAPDGRTSGGTNPRRSAGSTVVGYWRRLF